MSDHRFLPWDTLLTKKEIILKYNELIEEIWLLQHQMKDLNENYDLLLQDYEEVSNKLYG